MREENAEAPSADGPTLAERRRAEFEAERKAMQVFSGAVPRSF